MSRFPLPARALAALLAVAAAVPACANPFDWIAAKLGGKGEDKAQAEADAAKSRSDATQPDLAADAKGRGGELRDRGPVAIKPGEPAHFLIGDEAPLAELPKGRSHFRRVEVQGSVAKAHVRVTVLAQDAPQGKGHSVFKPLLYVLDGEGNIKNTLEFDPLDLDIRPFKRTRLNGCVAAEGLERFLVATAEKSVGSNYESQARDAVKAPTQSGFFYSSTEALKVKLPYAGTGELTLTVVPAATDKQACGKPAKAGDSAAGKAKE